MALVPDEGDVVVVVLQQKPLRKKICLDSGRMSPEDLSSPQFSPIGMCRDRVGYGLNLILTIFSLLHVAGSPENDASKKKNPEGRIKPQVFPFLIGVSACRPITFFCYVIHSDFS